MFWHPLIEHIMSRHVEKHAVNVEVLFRLVLEVKLGFRVPIRPRGPVPLRPFVRW